MEKEKPLDRFSPGRSVDSGRSRVDGVCPHCGVFASFTAMGDADLPEWPTLVEDRLVKLFASLHWVICPRCQQPIIDLVLSTYRSHSSYIVQNTERLHPRSSGRSAPPPLVPKELRRDYMEAVACEPHSLRASAALLRRCLQNAIRNAGFKPQRNLRAEIALVKEDPRAPTPLRQVIDTVREIGNIAAHPNRDPSTGDLLEVEPREVEVLFAAIDMLFDVYFVRPAEHEAELHRLYSKLGKSPPAE